MNKIVVSICTLGLTRMEWAVKLRSQNMVIGRSFEILVIQGVSPVSAARNLALYEAKKKNAKYCLFYDDDVIPKNEDAIAYLVSAMDQTPDATLIGGVYPIRSKVPEPVLSKGLGGGPWFGWREGRLDQVYFSGTSFLLIRMADLEDIKTNMETVEGELVKQYFSQYTKPGDYLGTDDYFFAELMEKNNKKWFVHGSVICDQMDRDGTRYDVNNSIIKEPCEQ